MERLIVKNFGPIKEIDIEIKDVNVLIGTTASGKSTVAKLWAVFNSEELVLKGCDLKSFKAVCKEYGLDGMIRETTLLYYEDGDRIFEYKSGKFSNNIPQRVIDYFIAFKKFSEMQGTTIAIPFFRQLFLNETAPEELVQLIEDSELLEKFLKIKDRGTQKLTLKEAFSRIDFVEDLEKLLSNKYLSKNISMYIPAERTFFPMLSGAIFGLLNKGVNIIDIIKEFGANLEISREEDKRVRVEFLNVDYVYSGGQNWVILSDGIHARLSHTASGFQSVIPAYVILDHLNEVAEVGENSIIIEEPELNLYPNTQKDFLEYLIRVTNKTKSKLFITTHSPYILTSLDNLVQAHNVVRKFPEKEAEVSAIVDKSLWVDFDNVTCYFFDEGGCKSTLVKLDEDGDEIRSMGPSAIDDVSENIAEKFDALLDLKYS